MADREKILRYFKASGDDELAARLLDIAEFAKKTSRYKVSEFLDPHGYNVAEVIAANFDNIKVEANGGFNGAERKRVAFISEEYRGTVDFELTCFLVKWDKRYYEISHRDVLGAFMGIGCKREILGDIVFVPDGAQFVADSSFANFIQSNLTGIASANVSLEEIAESDLLVKEEKVKVISSTVATLRLDAIAAAGYGMSRSRMADEIKGQNVKINWKEAKNGAQSVNEGDVISFRGRGRVEVAEIRGTTKKGRTAVTLKRYI